jgi:hypothetical protein
VQGDLCVHAAWDRVGWRCPAISLLGQPTGCNFGYRVEPAGWVWCGRGGADGWLGTARCAS